MSDEIPEGELTDGDSDSTSVETSELEEFFRVGALIRIYKDRAGWSSAELSSQSGIEEGVIKRLIRGATRNPQNQTLERLADTFARRFPDLTRDELLADFIDAKNNEPSRFDADPEAKIISARLKAHSTKFRKFIYGAIATFIELLEDAHDLRD